jgi:Organic solute transporter Ostalpha
MITSSYCSFYLYAVVTINISQGWALYCLGLFYVNTKQWIGVLRPLVKFGLIKIIVFVFFWQSFAIAVAGSIGLLQPMWGLSLHDTGAVLQNTIIEAELVLCAVAHHYFFSYHDFYSEDPTVITPIMRMQMEEAEFDKRQAAEAEQKALQKANGNRARTETDSVLSDPSFAALADPSLANSSVLVKTPANLKTARSNYSNGESTASTNKADTNTAPKSFYGPSRTASLSVPITATHNNAANGVSNFNLAEQLQQTPRRVSAAAALPGSAASARSAASAASGPGASPDEGPVVVVTSPHELDLFPESFGNGANSSSNPNTAASSSTSKRSSLENPFDAVASTTTTAATTATPGSGVATRSGTGAADGDDDVLDSGVFGSDGSGMLTNAPAPLPVTQALYEMLPIDVIQETTAQIKSGFGLIHKLEKRKAEEARAMEVIRNSERAKKSKFAQGTAASVGSGLRAPGDVSAASGATATNSVAGSQAGSLESSRRSSMVASEHAAVSVETAAAPAPLPAAAAPAAPAPSPAVNAPAVVPEPEPFMDWQAMQAKVAIRSKSRKEMNKKEEEEVEEDDERDGGGRSSRGGASRKKKAATGSTAAAASNPFDDFA